MDFQEKLKGLITRIEGNMPPQYLKIMHGATKALASSSIKEKVLKVGNTLPAFTLPNQEDQPVSSQRLLEKGPVVITFYRGFWCPYCNADLANLKRYTEEITAAGATLLAISPELPQYSKKIIATQRLNFDILTDKSNAVAAQMGLKFRMPQDLIGLYRDNFNINLKQYHGDDEWALPMPARFLIDGQGTIRYAESHPDYRQRPNPDDLMAALKALPTLPSSAHL